MFICWTINSRGTEKDMLERAEQLPKVRRETAHATRPRFMTRSMWLAWLLRSDVRSDATPGDVEAQREFVAWWLLWGRTGYPTVWHWGRLQAAVAMQLVPLACGLRCPRLLRRLHSSRLDLQQAFPLQDEEGLPNSYSGIACPGHGAGCGAAASRSLPGNHRGSKLAPAQWADTPRFPG